MNRNQILEFINTNPAFSLATVEDGKPRVRTLWLHKADETGIYFMVAKLKDVYKQISLNPTVELCFHDKKMQIRVRGVAENLDRDTDLKKEILEARPFLKEWIEQKGFKFMAVFRIVAGEASVWTLETEFQQKEPVIL